MPLGERLREYVMGPRSLEASSLEEFITLGVDNRLFYVDAYPSLLRTRQVRVSASGVNIHDLLTSIETRYKGRTNKDTEVLYTQPHQQLDLPLQSLSKEQKDRIILAAFLTAHLTLQQIQKQIPTVAVKLFDNRRALNRDDIQQLLLDAESLGVKAFPVR